MPRGSLVALLTTMLCVLPVYAQQTKPDNILRTPPPHFKRISTLTTLPEYLPGLGILYVDPSTIPVGPYLGYDKAGQLVNVLYMIRIKDFDDQKNLDDLGAKLPHLRFDHTDVDYDPGDPGLQAEPHYHIIEWLISHAEHQRRVP